MKLRLLSGFFFLSALQAIAVGYVYAGTSYRAEISTRSGSPREIVLSINGVQIFSLLEKPINSKISREILSALNNALRSADATKGIAFSEEAGFIKLLIPPKVLFKIPIGDLIGVSENREEILNTLQQRLSVALGKRPFAIEPPELLIPVGEERRYKLVSTISPAKWSILNRSPDLITVKPTAEGFSLFGIKEGSGEIVLQQGAVKSEIPFKVQYLAAYLPSSLTLEYVGEPPSVSEITNLAKSQLIADGSVSRGTALNVFFPEGVSASLADAKVKVLASAEGRIPVSRELPLVLRRVSFSPERPQTILFSNRPEQVIYPGELYSASITSGETTHFLFHHQNKSGKPLLFRLSIESLSPSVQKVLISGGASTALLSTYDAGFVSARKRLIKFHRGQGQVLRLAPYARTTFWEEFVSPEKSVSGNLDFSVLGSGAVAIRLWALDTEDSFGVSGDLPDNPHSFVSSPPVYTPGFLRKEFSFDADGNWLFIRIGKGESSNPFTGEILSGDYGVLYEILVTVENNSPYFKNLSLSLDATGGLARGVFIIDGNLIETPLVQPGKPYRLISSQLSPYERRKVEILTTTISGSHYPVSIIFSAD